MGRPKLELDEAEMERLAKAQCSNVRIAAAVGCDEGTLRGRFSELLTRWRNLGKINLEVAMMQKALDGNVPMQIHLSKQYLGHSDRARIEVSEAPADPLAAYAGDPELRERALQLERDLYDAGHALDTSDTGQAHLPGVGIPAAHSEAGSVCDAAAERPDGESGDYPTSSPAREERLL